MSTEPLKFDETVEFNEYPKDTMFLRIHIGDATFEDGEKVEVSQNVGGGSMIFTFKDMIYTVTPSQLLNALLEHRRKKEAVA